MLACQAVADKLGVHVASVQIGDSVQDDIKNSYLITMDEQVAVFASKVRQVSASRAPRLASLGPEF